MQMDTTSPVCIHFLHISEATLHKIFQNLLFLCYKYHWKDLGVGGRIILGWILGKQGRRLWTGFIWLRIQTSGELV
jgi:hypothetical protein